MKKSIVASMLAGALFLSGCGGTADIAPTENNDAGNTETTGAKKAAVVRMIDNDAFLEMGDSFQDKMKELGYADMVFEEKSAQGDMSTLNTIAAEVKNGDYDLVVTVATPATQAMVNAGVTAPVVFISVSDPVGAGILSSLETPDKNATGTSNIVPVDEILSLGEQLTPGIQTVGLLYCAGEKNSALTAENAKTYFESVGITVVETTVVNSSEVQQAAQTMADGIDCFYIPNDSVIQAAMPQLVEVATGKGIPVYGSDPVMVQNGALACVSVSNTQLGHRAAEMADMILKGAAVADVPAEAMDTFRYVVSAKTAAALGITIPETEGMIVME